MLYTQLTKNEIEAITKILNSHSIKHSVEVNGEFIEAQNKKMKEGPNRLNRHGEIRRGNTFYNLLIEKEDFDRIPLDSQKLLERYNIYPELSAEVFHAETERIVEYKKEEKEPSRLSYVGRSAMVILIVTIAALHWIDRYIVEFIDW